MDSLSQDALQEVLKHCDLRSLAQVAQTCQSFQLASQQELRRRPIKLGSDEGSILHFAAMRVDVPMAEAALRANLDPNAQSTTLGLTPLAYLLRHSRGGSKRGRFVKLLIEAGADPELSVGDRAASTALHIASFEADLGIVNALIEGGANPNSMNCMGQTPLHLAARRRAAETVEVIHCADMEAATRSGSYALHYGILSRNAAIVSALLSRGARRVVRDDDARIARASPRRGAFASVRQVFEFAKFHKLTFPSSPSQDRYQIGSVA